MKLFLALVFTVNGTNIWTWPDVSPELLPVCLALGVTAFNRGLSSRPQEAILDIKQIRVSYLRTWFIPDVIAAFPIGYILLFAVKTNRTCALAGITRLKRVIL